jgi:thiamine transporter ThiT
VRHRAIYRETFDFGIKILNGHTHHEFSHGEKVILSRELLTIHTRIKEGHLVSHRCEHSSLCSYCIHTTMAARSIKPTIAILSVNSVGNVAILHALMMPLLEKDSLSMVSEMHLYAIEILQLSFHRLIKCSFITCIIQYHLDPSVIIQTPLPPEFLVKVITYSFGWNIIALLAIHLTAPAKRPRIISTITSIVSGSIFTYLIFILCGFHPGYFPIQTLLASFYVAMNTALCATSIPEEDSIKENQSIDSLISKQIKVWNYLLGPSVNSVQFLHQATFYGSLIGMGVLSILRILDHGMQIQRHPVPILLGLVWGRVGGLVAGLIWGLVDMRMN